MPGWQDVLNQLRALKEQQLRQYDPNRVLDELRAWCARHDVARVCDLVGGMEEQ